MFQQQPSEIPEFVPQNPTPSSSSNPVPSPPTANGFTSPVSFPTPLNAPPPPSHQPGQIPQTVLEELLKTPPISIVQILAYNTLHEGEFRYIKNGPKFSVLDS